jgi:hypothetical protein
MFVIQILSDNRCNDLQKKLHAKGFLICDLPPSNDFKERRRWLVGTFTAIPVLLALREAKLPVFSVERARLASVDESDLVESELITRAQQMDRVGAEKVCPTASLKGSLMLAMAANELTLRPRPATDLPLSHAPFIDQLIDRYAAQPHQWVTPNRGA